jgi:glycosyltransferase involved in cell wall biosynthesis
MKSVVVFEFFWGGHRAAYLNTVSKTFLDLGCRVVACSPQPDQVKPFENASEIPEGRFFSVLFTLNDVSKAFGGTFGVRTARWKRIALFVNGIEAMLGNKADFVFFNFLDSLHLPFPGNIVVDAIFPYSWGGLYVQPCRVFDEADASLAARINWILNPFSVFNAQHCKMFALLNETIRDRIEKKISHSKIVTFPDFADGSLPLSELIKVKELRERAQGRIIVGLFGYLKKYKGIFTFIEVAKTIDKSGFFFLIAGDCSPTSFSTEEFAAIKAFMDSNPENCMFVTEYIADERDYNALFNVVDVVFAAFLNFPYSSNTVTKAALFKKPIIVSNGHCMSQRVKEYRLGSMVEQGNAHQVIDVLTTIRRGYNDFLDNARFDEFANLHSADRLKPLFAKILEIDLGAII